MAVTEGRVVRRKIGGVVRKPRSVKPVEPSRPLPRITRLMALAIYFDELIRTGQVESYADLAKIGRVSRARVTQIMGLLNLPPSVQDNLISGHCQRRFVTERSIRELLRTNPWKESLSSQGRLQ
jgi:hypothetical protein